MVRAGANGAAHLFQSIAIIARRGTFDGPARRYARGLAAQFKGQASQESSTSLREAAIEGATLVVLAQPSPGSSALAAERGGPRAAVVPETGAARARRLTGLARCWGGSPAARFRRVS